MIGCCISLKHLTICTLDHGSLVFSEASEEKATRYTDYDACLICQKGADIHSRSMPKLTDQGYPALLYAITNRKDEISFRIRWTPTQTFWKRIWSVLHGIAPSTLIAQLLTREKTSIRNSNKTLRSSTSQPVNYKEECFIY